MVHYLADNYMFHNFGTYARQGDGSVVTSLETFTFFINRGYICCFSSIRDSAGGYRFVENKLENAHYI